jgi:hypothetical protein
MQRRGLVPGAWLLAVSCAVPTGCTARACDGGARLSPAARAAPDGHGAPRQGGGSTFPSWSERVLHAWTNRARADPRAELAGCSECADRDCYSPVPPLEWSEPLNRAARFHADEMSRQGFFQHDSRCRIVPDIAALYPRACDGSESCACGGRGGTRWSDRLALFGVARPSGEVQAEHRDDPASTLRYLLHEPASSPECVRGAENGHRWNMLKLTGTVGYGVSGSYAVGDFDRSPGPGRPLPSGAHYPRQADTVEFWASWYAPAGPTAAFVDVDGECTALALGRGSPTNGAYFGTTNGLATGCHRYFFVFRDADGAEVTYPETGSFGLGPESTCADWEHDRPARGPTCG